MSQEALERIRKHFGRGDFIEIKNENGTVDKFYMPMAPANRYGDLWHIFNKIRQLYTKNKDDEYFDVFEHIDKETFNLLVEIASDSLYNSKDFEGINQDEIQQFVLSNFTSIFNVIFAINDFGSKKVNTDELASKRAESIKKRVEKNARTDDKESERKISQKE